MASDDSSHPARPDRQPRWRGLQIVDTVAGRSEDTTGIVEFRATYLQRGGGVGVLHERSRFIREHGRWFYVDGAVREDA